MRGKGNTDKGNADETKTGLMPAFKSRMSGGALYLSLRGMKVVWMPQCQANMLCSQYQTQYQVT